MVTCWSIAFMTHAIAISKHMLMDAYLWMLYRPLYKGLASSSAEGKRLAQETFTVARATYHPIAAKMVAADLGA